MLISSVSVSVDGHLHPAGFATLAYASRRDDEADEGVLARDLTGAVRALRRRPEADAARIVLAGTSVGGSTVAYALGTQPGNARDLRADAQGRGVTTYFSETTELLDRLAAVVGLDRDRRRGTSHRRLGVARGPGPEDELEVVPLDADGQKARPVRCRVLGVLLQAEDVR